MIRYLYSIFQSFFLLAVISCNEEDNPSPPFEEVKMSFVRHGSGDLFANHPIKMYPFPQNSSREAYTYKWSMGDGAESSESTPTHTFTSPGIYTVRLTVNLKYYKDSTVVIHPKPLMIGEKNTKNVGKFIYSQNAGYQILYFQEFDSKIVTLSETHNILETKPIKLDNSSTLSQMLINSEGNLVGLDDQLWQIDPNGHVLWQKSAADASMMQSNLIESEDGYYFFNGFFKGNDHVVILKHVDDSGTLVEALEVGNSRGWEPIYGEFEQPDIVRLHYVNDAGKPVIWKGKISGETIFEREYESSHAGKSFKIEGGYLCIGVLTDENDVLHYYVYTMIDEQGNVRWTTYNPWSTYERYWKQYPIQVIHRDGYNYIFYGEMNGVKLDSNGTILWLKRFTFLRDRFCSVTVNKNQNFVLLGTHCDLDGDAIEDDDSQIFVLEVDEDGKIID